MDTNFANSTRQFAVITGASSGIGVELAKQFAEHGFDVMIAAGSDDTERAARELEMLGVNVSLSQSLREELKDTGVSVTALMPGATETNFFHRAGADDTNLGFEALMDGKDHVVAGSFKNKLQAMAGYTLPDPMVAKAHAAMSEPGSANKK